MPPPLYNYRAVADAIDERVTTVWIAADLPDAEALTAEGLVATCTVGRTRRWTDECSDALGGANRIVVSYTHDDADDLTGRRRGHERARWIYLSLRDAGVKRITFRRSPYERTVAKHFHAGHPLDELVQDSPEGGQPDWHALELFDIWRDHEALDESAGADRPWQTVDVASIIKGLDSGEITGPVPTILARGDGRCLLYRGEVHSIAGEPEGGKGWIALEACAQVLRAGGRALYIDLDQPSEVSVIARLLALGVNRQAMIERLDYVSPQNVSEDALGALPLDDYALAVIDSVSEALSLLGLSPDKNSDVAAFLNILPRPLARRGAAVLLIDHVIKDKRSRGRWATGSQHKLAGVAVAYMVDVTRPPTRTQRGTLALKLAKDRHGHIGRRGEVVAVVEIAPQNDGKTVSVSLMTPGKAKLQLDAGESAEPSPQKLLDVSRVIEQAQTPPSAKALRLAVGGNAQATDEAAEWLLANGYVDTPVGKRAKRWTTTKPYRMSE